MLDRFLSAGTTALCIALLAGTSLLAGCGAGRTAPTVAVPPVNEQGYVSFEPRKKLTMQLSSVIRRAAERAGPGGFAKVQAATERWAADAEQEIPNLQLDLAAYGDGQLPGTTSLFDTYCDDRADALNMSVTRFTLRWGVEWRRGGGIDYAVLALPQIRGENERGVIADTRLHSRIEDTGRPGNPVERVVPMPLVCRYPITREIRPGLEPGRPRILEDLDAPEYGAEEATEVGERLRVSVARSDGTPMPGDSPAQRRAFARAQIAELRHRFPGVDLGTAEPSYIDLGSGSTPEDRRTCLVDKAAWEVRTTTGAPEGIIMVLVSRFAAVELAIRESGNEGAAKVTEPTYSQCTGYETVYHDEVIVLSTDSPRRATGADVLDALTTSSSVAQFASARDLSEDPGRAGDALGDVPRMADLDGIISNAQVARHRNTDGTLVVYVFQTPRLAREFVEARPTAFSLEEVDRGARFYQAGCVVGAYSARGATTIATSEFEAFMRRVGHV